MRGIKPRLVVSNEALTIIPQPPAGLPKAAKDEWRKVVPDLLARNVLTETDMTALANYCIAIARVQECAKILARGAIIKAPDKTPKAHPAVRIQHQFLETARRYAAEFGLTPVGRQRAGGKSAKPSDDADEWA